MPSPREFLEQEHWEAEFERLTSYTFSELDSIVSRLMGRKKIIHHLSRDLMLALKYLKKIDGMKLMLVYRTPVGKQHYWKIEMAESNQGGSKRGYGEVIGDDSLAAGICQAYIRACEHECKRGRMPEDRFRYLIMEE